MADLNLLKFPTTTEAKIQSHINRLRKDLWEADSGEYIIEILQIAEEYLLDCPEDISSGLALVNLQGTILFLDYYFRG